MLARLVTDRTVLVGLGCASILSLGAAFYSQYVLGYLPCSLCLLARWPHVFIIAAVVVTLLAGAPRPGLVLAVSGYVVVFAISGYHNGVEQGWLALPGACAVTTPAADLNDLRQALLQQANPSCDQPSLVVLGFSMAVWHAVAATGFAGIAAWQLTRRTA